MGKGGEVFKYHRKTRAPLPNNISEGDPEFVEAWLAEESKTGPKRSKSKVGTVAATCEAYLGSRLHADTSKDYRRSLRSHVEAIRVQAADAMMVDLKAAHIQGDFRDLSPSVARARRKAWRRICGFAFDMNWISVDPSDSTKAKPMPRTDGHLRWSADEIDAYRARWGIETTARRAFEVLFWTAARTIDAVALSQGNVGRDGILTFGQSKTGGTAYVPWTASLPDWGLDMEADRQYLIESIEATKFTFLETKFGKSRSHKGLSNLISDAASDAGIVGRSAHGLRKSRLTILAESGASTHAIMSWGGHKSIKEADEYTRSANKKKLITGTEIVNRAEIAVNLLNNNV